MAKPPSQTFLFQKRFWTLLFLSLLVSLFVLGLPLDRGKADSGGFPTRTPTVTPPPPTAAPTFTPTVTVGAEQVIPTLTDTPVATEPILTPLPGGVIATEQPVPTPEEGGGGGAMACLPIAIIFILGVVIAATWYLTRGAREVTSPY